MKTILKIAVILVIVVVFVGTIVYLYKKSQAEPVVFETTTAFKTDIIRKTVATGSVVPRKEIEITPKVSGIIEEIFVEPGDVVKKDQLIARVKIIPDMINLNNAESRVKRAKIQLEEARKNHERYKSLYEEEVIPEAEFLTFDIAFRNAREEVESAEDNLQLIREGATKKAGNVTNTLIRSTIDGMVLDVPVEEGNSVIESNTFNNGTVIATIADMSEMIFEGKVDESEVGKISEGMPLIMTIGAIENETFDAVLEHISPKGIEENGTIQFEIRAAVDLKENQFIRAGYSANADIVLERKDQVLAVNEGYLLIEKDTTYVEVEVSPQQFEKRIVKTGLSDGINIEIIEGLSETDKIKAATL
ncbi:MAG: efflux RND transporter periplasmic adaptor subunit [Bacteroidales bacterium]|jgi:HlyD family secretion protein|nr:efflux RND transporter periplasmic adaptor subunit [Bacteroidales bacterium]MDD4086245.1 efflux RND transporter periplasmic adaptor subunit [Bacteroidales bacterium]MDY0085300.1 efflux RND transporter periplasmic adaptor subunit [Bacteroidales bacterium]